MLRMNTFARLGALSVLAMGLAGHPSAKAEPPESLPADTPVLTPSQPSPLAGGKDEYNRSCGLCHTITGKDNPMSMENKKKYAPQHFESAERLTAFVRNPAAYGKGMLPVSPSWVSDEQMRAIYQYIDETLE